MIDDPECAGAFSDVSLAADGTFELDDAGTLDSNLTISVKMTLSISEACLSALAGMSRQWTADACDGYGDTLESELDGTVSCSLSGNACRCAVTQASMPLVTSTMFEIEGNELTEPDGSMSTFCQEGDSLRITSEFGTLVFARN